MPLVDFYSPRRAELNRLGCAARYILVLVLGLSAAETLGSWPPPVGPEVRKFVFHPTNQNLIYAATRGGVFITIDRGDTWTRPAPPLQSVVWALVMHPDNPNIVFAGVEGLTAGMHVTRDGGKTWKAFGPFINRPIWAFAIDPKRPEVMFAATNPESGESGKSLFRSIDAGANWKLVLKGHEIGVDAVLVASNGTVFVGANGIVLRSPDRGDTWFASGDVVPGRSVYVEGLVVDPRDPQLLYANSSRGLIESVDGGRTWMLRERQCMHYRPAPHSAVLFALCPEGGSWPAHSGGPTVFLQRSHDRGRTWTRMGSGLPKTWLAINMAIHPADSKTIYTSWSNGGVYKSTDGGETWNPRCTGLTWRELGEHHPRDPSASYNCEVQSGRR